jgi:hypothetical protein
MSRSRTRRRPACSGSAWDIVSCFDITRTVAAGMSIAERNRCAHDDGLLSGVPTEVGNDNFTVRAVDANSCQADQAYALAVGENPDVIFRDGFDG